jgi:hypothetical protein
MISTSAEVTNALREIIVHPTGGVVGLVDALFELCARQGLHLDWRADQVHVRVDGGGWETVTGVAIRKSVFRAVLARVAELCVRHSPGAVSPYGGQAELALPNNEGRLAVTFTNTSQEQLLQIR